MKLNEDRHRYIELCATVLSGMCVRPDSSHGIRYMTERVSAAMAYVDELYRLEHMRHVAAHDKRADNETLKSHQEAQRHEET